jgi:hypothetical protein
VGCTSALGQCDRCNAVETQDVERWVFLEHVKGSLEGLRTRLEQNKALQVRPKFLLFRRDGVFVTYICNHALIHPVNFDTLPSTWCRESSKTFQSQGTGIEFASAVFPMYALFVSDTNI